MTVVDNSRLPRVGECSIKWLRRSIVASSSLLALSAAMKLDAAQAQTCGLPVGGIVTCGETSYPSGIAYDVFDDLTVNVGAPAGQDGTVTVDDTIVLNDMFHAPEEVETLQVGGNVTVRAAGSGESVQVFTSASHNKAVSSAVIVNGAAIATSGMGGGGIKAFTNTLVAAYAPSDGESVATSFASVSVDNGGLIVTSGDFGGGIRVSADALETKEGSYSATMSALSQVHNSGDMVTIGGGSQAIYAGSFITTDGEGFYQGRYNHDATVVGSADEADVSISNAGHLRTSGISADGIDAKIDARGYSDTVLAAETVTNNGAIDTTGDYAVGIKARVWAEGNGLNSTMATAQVNIINSGTITTGGDYADGIVVTTHAMAWDRGASSIASATSLNNSAAISTSGDYSEGIQIQTVSESRNQAAASISAAGQVVNTGGITTAGIMATAIDVSEKASGVGASLYAGTIVVNSGALTTAGLNAFGIDAHAVAEGLTTGAQDVRVRAMVKNDGAIATAGQQADAITVTASAQGFAEELDAIVNAYNTGALVTLGGNSRGLYFSSSTIDIGGTVAQTASITANNSGAITTSGDVADAINAFVGTTGVDSTAGATAIVDNSGNLTTGGRSARGVYTFVIATISGSDGASLEAASSVKNSASITTLGDYADGISETVLAGGSPTGVVTTLQASIAADNSGTIDTSGIYANGIDVFAVTGNDVRSQTVTTTADNSGTIMTSGDNAKGIRAEAMAGDNSVALNAVTTVNNSGLIKTAGANADAVAASSVVYGGVVDFSHILSSAAVYNTGRIATSGDGSSAIKASATLIDGSYAYNTVAGHNNRGRLTLTIRNAGTLTTTGAYAAAIKTTATGKSYGTEAVYFGTMASINNSGAISTSGASSSGISATATLSPNNSKPQVNSRMVIANTGTILVSGDGGAGIVSESTIEVPAPIVIVGVVPIEPDEPGSGYDVSQPAPIVIVGIVPIEPDDPGSGYDVYYDISHPVIIADIRNSGSIDVSGRYGAGIVVTARSSGTLGTVCDPDIHDCDMAAYIAATARVENSGLIRASGYGGIGVVANADTVLIDNLAGATITGGTGASAAAIVAQGKDITVTNAGTINSANDHALALIGTGNVTLTNDADGKIVGHVTLSSPNSAFENDGTWTARGGDSDFTPATGGSSIVVNRGKVLVVGNQVFKGVSEFDNAGLLSLSAVNASTGTRTTFEKLVVTGDFAAGNGSTLQVGSDMTSTADVLEVDGRISGTTDVKLDKHGAPGLTSGNGILVVDAHLGTTSASNFRLIGNTAGGTLLDGAYEYGLGLVSGSAGHGMWYLSSRIYPANYQFGQIGSSALLLSQQAGDWFGNVLLNWGEGGGTLHASAAPPVRVASNDASFVPSAPAAGGLGLWGGVDGASLGVSPSGSAFGDYRLHSTIGHVGLDAVLEGNYGTAVLGLTVNPIDASALFRDFASTHMKMTGYTWSGYAFWVDGSWRAGLQFGAGRVNTHFTDSYVGTDARVTMNTVSIQGVAAYKGRLDDDTWFEPAAMVGFTTLDGGSFTNGVGDMVSFGDTDSVLARLGLRIGRTYELDWGALKPHVDVAVRYEAEGATSVAIGNFAYSSGLGGASGQVGGGATLEIGDGVRLFADALYSAGAKVSGWQGSVGLRFTR